MKIRTRLLICVVAAVAAGFVYLAVLIRDEVRPRHLEAIEDSLVDTSTILAALLAADARDGRIDPARFRAAFAGLARRRFEARVYQLLKTQTDVRVYVTDERGVVVFDSDGGRAEGLDYSRWNDVYRTLRGEYGARSTRHDPANQESSVLYVAAPVMIDGRVAGVLTVCKPTTSSNFFLVLAKKKLFAAAGAVALGVILLGVAASVWVTRPIEKLTAYARAVRDGKRAALPRLGRSEVGVLGASFEEMKDALEGKEYVERYVQTLTHEIKGPLTAIRGAVELLQEREMAPEQRERFLENLRVETGRIQQVVDRLLLLSSLERRKGVRDVEELDLAELVAEAARALEAAAQAKGLTIKVDAAGSVPMRGERFLLRHAVANLLQNAADFTPPGGTIAVSCSSDSRRAVVSVANQGPHVPDFALPRVFERFYSLPRPDTGKKSSGLGLPFVQEVAGLHGGSARLENLPSGGVQATLTLALSPPAAG